MKKNDRLRNLINSLTRGEQDFIQKSFALLSTKRAGEFQDLFGKLASDDRHKKPGEQNNVSVRYALRNHILRYMQLYRKPSKEDQILDNMRNYHFLRKKGLYDQAIRALDKAIALAKELEEVSWQIILLQVEKHRVLESERRELSDKIVSKNQQQVKLAQQWLEEVNAQMQYHLAFAGYREQGNWDKQYFQQGTQITLSENSSFYAKTYFWSLKAAEARAENNYAEAASYCKRILHLWRGNKTLMGEFPGKMIVFNANYGMAALGTRAFEEVEQAIENLEDLPHTYFDWEAERFQNIALLKILLALEQAPDSSVTDLIDFTVNGLQHYHVKINPARELTLWYNLLLLTFIYERFDESQAWINKIIAHKRFNIRKEIQYVTRLIEPIVQYEAGNLVGLDSLLNAVYMFFYSNEKLGEFEKAVLRHLRKLTDLQSQDESSVLFRKFKMHLERDLPFSETRRLGFSLCHVWATSKVRNVPIQTLLPLNYIE
ncbi:MAG: hypothetical protein AAF998_02100 [Bacteroidota bacterium]